MARPVIRLTVTFQFCLMAAVMGLVGLAAAPAHSSPVTLFTGAYAGGKQMYAFDGVAGGTALQSFGAATGGAGYQDVEIGPDGNVYAAQYSASKIVRFDGVTYAALPGYGQSGADYSTGTPLSALTGIAFGPDGDLYVNNGSGSVNRFQGPSGTQPGQFVSTFLSGLGTIDDIEFIQGEFYITARGNKVLRYTAAGVPDPAPGHTGAVFADSTDGLAYYTTRLAEGPDGFLYVSDNVDIWRFDSTTGLGSKFITGFAGGMAFGPHDGNLYIADYSGNRIRQYDGVTGALLNINFATGIDLSPTFLTFRTPEPGSAVLLALGGLAVSLGWGRRRGKRARCSCL